MSPWGKTYGICGKFVNSVRERGGKNGQNRHYSGLTARFIRAVMWKISPQRLLKTLWKRWKSPSISRFCTLSTEFSTFNTHNPHRLWKESTNHTIQQFLHTGSTIPWKTSARHDSSNFPTFQHLPHPLLRLLQQVQYTSGGSASRSMGKAPENRNPNKGETID